MYVHAVWLDTLLLKAYKELEDQWPYKHHWSSLYFFLLFFFCKCIFSHNATHMNYILRHEKQKLSCNMRKPTLWILTRSDTNKAVQPLKMAMLEILYERSSPSVLSKWQKQKALISFPVLLWSWSESLILHRQNIGFLMMRLKLIKQ